MLPTARLKIRRDARARRRKEEAGFGSSGRALAAKLGDRPTMTQGREPMRTRFSPLFKRYEIIVVVAFALIFVLMASLNVIF